MKKLVFFLVLAIGGVFPLMGMAISPDEMLEDPALEQRARTLSQELRCVVCQNQSIDDSDADLAKDLRVIVREQLLAGQNEAQIKSYLVDRYGEFILFRPRFSRQTLFLWIGPFVFLLMLLGGGYLFYRSRSKTVSSLSKREEEELKEILAQDGEKQS
ncbi:cytochrome c-type biogenesis protein CcmH [Alphaproteobacteria bacterium]|jgi:cytochrome c-type biogenesis protein CcmH|nr:cytochrome c-type biogenesis protein CcmH [Alphaproteobacteria bacterium]